MGNDTDLNADIEAWLGLARPRSSFPFRLLEWGLDPDRNRVYFVLSDGRDGEHRISIGSADEPRFFRKTTHLTLSFHGESLDLTLGLFLIHLAKRLRNVRYEPLIAWAIASHPTDPSQDDAGVGREAPKIPQTPEPNQRSEDRASSRDAVLPGARELKRLQTFSPGTPHGWSRFNLGREREPNCEGVAIQGLATVTCQDPECLSFPPILGRSMHFLRHRHVPGARLTSEYRFVNLDERDVLMGGTEKLVSAMEQTSTSPSHECAFLHFTCTPLLIGDNLGAACHAYSSRSPRVLLCPQWNRTDPARYTAAQLRRAFERALQAAPAVESNLFNLAGYTKVELDGETRLLESMGIRLNVSLLPDFSLEMCERFLRAPLLLVSDRPFMKAFREEVFDSLPMTRLVAPPPVGLAESKAWCASIASALGYGGEFDAQWEVHTTEIRERFLALRDEVQRRRLRVAFVVDRDTELEAYLLGRDFQGVSLFERVVEMGFEVEIHAMAKGREPSGSEGIRVRTAFGVHDVEVFRFASPSELRQLITRSRADLFHSEFTYDWRLASCGKASFSRHDLDPGVLAAARNLSRFLNLCSMSFYRRYGRHLPGTSRWSTLISGWPAGPGVPR